MKVSFGKTYIVNESGCPTKAQKYVDRIAYAAFLQNKKTNSDERKSIETLLEEKKGADVFIKNKSNGTVSVEVRQSCSEPNVPLWFANPGFIPYDAKGNLTLEKHNIILKISGNREEIKNAVEHLGDELDNFAQKAREYALKPENKLNKKLSEKNEIFMERKLFAAEQSGMLDF